jgi:hypothetical protein
MAKKLKYLFLHCSATPEDRDVTADDIIRMHTAPKSEGGRGWSRAGYRLIVRLDGELDEIVNVDGDAWVEANEITYGARGFNSVSHHICYAGGMDAAYEQPKDTRTEAQRQSLEEIVRWYVEHHPHIQILGHNQVASKACPSFDVTAFLRQFDVPEQNIYQG